jgi:regulator of sigma D
MLPQMGCAFLGIAIIQLATADPQYSKISTPSGKQSKDALFHLNASKLDNFCVLRDFVGNEFFEICNRHWHRFDP